MRKYPDLEERIKEVRQEGSFEVADLQWISRCFGFAVRLSMGHGTYKIIAENHPDASSDSIYGEGEIGAHLFFSYQKATCEDRHFGHYDLTVPGLGRVWFAHPEAQ